MIDRRPSLLQALTFIFSSFLLASCTSNSEITHSYVDPKLKQLDLSGVLVVAVTKQKSSRVDFEDSFTKALEKQNIKAVASHTMVPQQKAEAEQMIAAAKKAGLDTILVTRYIGKANQEVYHPGKVYYGVTPAYGGSYHGGFGGYYAHAYEVAYQQPVWTSNVTHSVISDLYVADTREHMWQAVSDTVQAGDNKKLRDDAIKSLIGNLKDQGLIH